MPWLRRLAYRLCGQWSAADDLVQECLVALYRHWRKAAAADSLDAYVRTMLIHACCQLFDLHLATGLLPESSVRHSGRPQRGPWPTLLTAVLGVVVLGAAFLLWRRLRPPAPLRQRHLE
ncbi:RNA polymerase sigma factor [Micromonospora chersina]|uniref:RNA polymerase sigma factor n=1 Tax=Micromonospora chersina TaxID=47854 RepID=UPI0033D10E62